MFVALSDLELASVTAAAARDGLANGAWLGETGYRVATGELAAPVVGGPAMNALMMQRAEMTELRRLLGIAGGNLNDVARHANSTGEVHAATARVLERVAATVDRIDRAVAGLDGLIGAAGRELGRSRR